MSITLAKDALSAVIGSFQIQKDDTQARSIAKFAGGTTLKAAVLALAGFEYGVTSMGSVLPIRSASSLSEYANEAAETFLKTAASLNHPFAPTTKTTTKWCGFVKETTTTEGRTVSSYMQDAKQTARKNKGLIATAVVLSAAAITLYYFGPSLFSTAASAKDLPIYGPENMPVFGPENMPVFGPENMPVFGPENMPVFGPENMPNFTSTFTRSFPNPFEETSPVGDMCPLFERDLVSINATIPEDATVLQEFAESDSFTQSTLSWFHERASSAAAQVVTKIPFSGLAATGYALKNPQHIQQAMTLGIIGSMFEALVLRAYNVGENAVVWGEKLSKCGQYAHFPLVNGLKQLELKTFALFSATIPFLFNLAVAKIRGEDIRDQFNRKNFIYYGTLFGLSLANPLYGNILGLTSRTGFDSSGHVMLKTALAPAVGSAIAKTAKISPVLGGALSSAYILSDGVFIKNTAQFCHTVDELKWGLGWGGAITAISSLASQIFG